MALIFRMLRSSVRNMNGTLNLYLRITPLIKENLTHYSSSVKGTTPIAEMAKKESSSKRSIMKSFGIALIETENKQKKLILSSDMQTKLKILQLELDELQHCGEEVPRKVKDEEWAELLLMKDVTDRLHYYQVLYRYERNAVVKQTKQQERYSNWKAKIAAHKKENLEHIIYGLHCNTLVPFVRKSTKLQFYKWRLTYAAKFGQHIVIDMGYSEYMTDREQTICINQLKDMYSVNKTNSEPFHFHFCNAPVSQDFMKKFYVGIPQFELPSFPIEITEKNYLELYPKEKLVYLTSHTDELLHQFNHDEIYIIGAYVDKTNKPSVSVAKAKKEGLRMAKFPIEHYLRGTGKRNLKLGLMMKILLTARDTNDWNKAFEHLIQRKPRKQEMQKLSKYRHSTQTQFKSILYDEEDE